MDWLVVLALRWRWGVIGSLGFSAVVAGLLLYWQATDAGMWQLFLGWAFLILGITVLGYCLIQLGRQLNDLYVQTQFYQHKAFDALYERSPVAYIRIDEQGNIQLANTAAVHLLGTTIDAVSSENFFRTLVNTNEVSTSVLKSQITSGATITKAEVPLVTFSHEEKWVQLSVFQPDSPNERLVALADITEQKAVDTAKSEFVALATHQLRTPIAAVRWNVELLEKSVRGTINEKQARYLEKVSRNVSRMLHLINDFLSVSKLEMGTYAAEQEEVELNQYLEEILQEFEERITQKHLTIRSQIEPSDLIIKTDRRLLHIIFSNLLSNAVKYTNDAGVVSVTVQATGGSMTLTVADNGIGVPSEELPKLFTKFYRASNAQAKVVEGTGLGLYVVKQSAEILGGSITVNSERDKGTAFVVQLPGVVVGNL